MINQRAESPVRLSQGPNSPPKLFYRHLFNIIFRNGKPIRINLGNEINGNGSLYLAKYVIGTSSDVITKEITLLQSFFRNSDTLIQLFLSHT